MADVTRASGIYALVVERPEGGPLFYVGQSMDITKRYWQHLTLLRSGRHFNRRLQNAYRKYQSISMDVLELVDDAEQLTERERYWWRRHVELYGRARVLNQTEPSDSPMRDPEVRERQAAATREATSNPEWRRKRAEANRKLAQDPEWRRKLEEGIRKRSENPEWRRKQAEASREANRRLAQDPAWLRKTAEANRRLARDPAWRRKQAEAGRKRSENPAWRRKTAEAIIAVRAKHYVFRSPEGERVEIYNLAAFCREWGLNRGHMVGVALGRRAHHKGWTRWEDDPDLTQ